MRTERIGHMNISKDSNPEPTVFWRSAATNCTARPTCRVTEHYFDLLPWICQQQPPSKMSYL